MTTEEIAAVVEEIRRRVRARYEKQADGVPDVRLPSLTPMLHARDAAAGKVASIGAVNPRPPGAIHSLVQGVKRVISRALAWHVREQIEFNRATIEFMDRALAVLDELNRNALAVARQAHEANQLSGDTHRHFSEWRTGWEEKWAKTEIHLLRSMAELQGAFHHRATLMESNFRDNLRAQHADYLGALDRGALDVQKRLWDDLAKLRQEHERQIQTELRLIRQRAEAWIESHAATASRSVPSTPATTPAAQAEAGANVAGLDYGRFSERFRGTAEYVAARQKFYLPFFAGRRRVLDVGCGRGEFLELMKHNGVAAQGVDCDAESTALCRQKGLEAHDADLFTYLAALPDASLDGVFSAQVVEHLAPSRVLDLVSLAAAKLEPGGVLAVETPNPECLAIFATNFYLDPTHVRPVPSALLHFYFGENGLGSIEVHQLAPAAETFPEIATLGATAGLAGFQQRFFGGMDYAIIGRKL